MAVWWNTEVECVSALSRVFRHQSLGTGEVEQALERLGALITGWSEMQPTDEVRVRAERLLFAHRLRASDALQLGAALLWCDDRPRRAGFVCLDYKLRTAARMEGFDVLPDRVQLRSPAHE